MPKPTTVINSVFIHRSMEDVFNFGTTPRHWPDWHPTAVSVSGAIDHPLQEGEQLVEKDRFVFLRGEIHWKLRKRSVPTLWIIDGVLEDIPLFSGTQISITYTLSSQDGGTLLKREMSYQVPNAFAKFLDDIYFRKHNVEQSQLAVTQLKKILEK